MAVIVEYCGVRHIVQDRAAWLIQYLVSTTELLEDVNRNAHGELHLTWGGGDCIQGYTQAFHPRRRPE